MEKTSNIEILHEEVHEILNGILEYNTTDAEYADFWKFIVKEKGNEIRDILNDDYGGKNPVAENLEVSIMNELQIFNNNDFGEIRTVEIDNKIYFVGADVAKSLGYARQNDAINQHCKGAVKRRILTNGGKQQMNIIPEGDLYRLIANSKLPTAEKFESWIFDEVLPVIRETGSYKTPTTKTFKTTLASVNNAVKIIGGYMKQAGITEDIQLLTVKGLYAKADVYLPLDIEADKVYYDTKQIAHKLGIRTKANKPAYHAVSQIIKELDIFKDEVKEVWETNGSWQGVVKKYSESIVDKIEEWLKENDYPDTINSDSKKYYVLYEILV